MKIYAIPSLSVTQRKQENRIFLNLQEPVILLDFLPPEYIIVVYLHIQTFPMKSSYHNEITHLHYKVIKGEQKYSKIFVEPNAKILEFFRGTSLDVKINSSFHPLRNDFQVQHGNMDTFPWTLKQTKRK